MMQPGSACARAATEAPDATTATSNSGAGPAAVGAGGWWLAASARTNAYWRNAALALPAHSEPLPVFFPRTAGGLEAAAHCVNCRVCIGSNDPRCQACYTSLEDLEPEEERRRMQRCRPCFLRLPGSAESFMCSGCKSVSLCNGCWSSNKLKGVFVCADCDRRFCQAGRQLRHWHQFFSSFACVCVLGRGGRRCWGWGGAPPLAPLLPPRVLPTSSPPPLVIILVPVI